MRPNRYENKGAQKILNVELLDPLKELESELQQGVYSDWLVDC